VYWASLGPRPPLYPLLAVTPLWLVGRSVDSILLVNCLSLIFLAYATFKLATRIFDSRAGFLSTALVLLYPVTTSLAKLARPHSLISSTVALALLAMYILAFDKASRRNIWFAAGSLLLVFGAHAGGLNLLVVPVVVAAWLSARRIAALEALACGDISSTPFSVFKHCLTSRLFLFSALPAIALLLAAMGGWMAVKWGQYQSMMDVARKIFRPMVSEWYYETSFTSALGRPASLFLLVALCTLACSRSSLPTQTKRGCDFLLQSLLGAFAFSHFASGGKSWHHMSGVVPMVAVLTGVGVVALLDRVSDRFQDKMRPQHRTALVMLLLTVVATMPYVAVNWASVGLASSASQFTGVTAPCERLRDDGACHHPPVAGNWHVRELMDALVVDARCKTVPCEVAVLGHRQDYFSDESLTYSLILEYPVESRRVSSAFYPERNVRFKRISGSEHDAIDQLKSSDYVLLILNSNEPSMQNRNHFFEKERELSETFVKRARGAGSDLLVVFEELLPTGESMMLIALHRASSN